MNSIDFWTIIIGCLVAIPCSLLGCFLVLRKMAMVSDAISHAVLPGIVISFLLTKSLDSFSMLFFASLFGLLTTFLIEYFNKKASLQEDAAIGIVFTFLFALGMFLIGTNGLDTELKPERVLMGEILTSHFNVWYTATGLSLGPKAVWILGSVNLLVLLFILIGFKELFLTSFDSSYAAAIGVPVMLWHYLLMGSVSVTTVASFESVGAILVICFLVVPATAAYLLTDQLKYMLLLSVLLGIVSTVLGYYLSIWISSTTSGCITLVNGLIFIIIFLLSPRYGVLIKHKTQHT